MKENFLWCDIDTVIPNPKNPRKDPGVKTEEIQNIIKSKGWEEGITAYRKGIFYIIISGHRRWYAAKAMGVPEVPVYVVPAPKDDKEELERLGSIQSGQVDWTPYEWAEYTYMMYEKLGKPTYLSLAKKFSVPKGLIAARIRVYLYFPRVEIETKLENGMFSLTTLHYLRGWLERLAKYHPDLVEAMGEDMIRHSMLRKLENNCFNTDIYYDQFVVKANQKQLLNFITDTKKTLSEATKEIQTTKDDVKIVNTKHNIRKVKMAGKQVNTIFYRTKKEALELKKALEVVEQEIEEKKRYLMSQLRNKNVEESHTIS